MADIDWSALQPGVDAFGNYARGEQIGRERAEENAKRTAFGMLESNPEGAISALMPYDPQTALSLRKMQREDAALARRQNIGKRFATDPKGAQNEALQSGDFDLASELGKLTDQQREAAKQQAAELAGFAYSLRELPYEQRKAAIAAQRAALMERGFSEQQIDGFDPTDAEIDALVGQSMDLADQLDQANKDRAYKMDQEKFAETKRSNRANEGLRAQSNATAAFSAQTGRKAFEERRKAGGFGTPGVGSAAIADEDVEIDP